MTIGKSPPSPVNPDASLLVSIHDVGPRSEGAVDRLSGLVEPYTGNGNFAMLVVPDHWRQAPIVPGSSFATRLRGWADTGVEMFVHGWFHLDETSHVRRLARWRASQMTAGEGEFLGIDEATALDRMVRGRDLIENIIGRPVAGFVAPAWLYGPGARSALIKSGFSLAEDHLRVWRPSDGAVLARSPVITWASRSAIRRASSLAVAAAARALLPPHRGMRLAVHPGDAGRQELVVSIDATLRTLSRRAKIGRYADLHREAPTAAYSNALTTH